MELDITNISVGYKGSDPLCEGVNLTVSAGQAVALIGSNGVGKSTLLRSLAGIVAPQEGRVVLGGRDILKLKPYERSRAVSFVSTEVITIAYLTVQQVVALGRAPYSGWAFKLSEQDRAAIDRAMELTGTTIFGERCLDTLSDGQRQRVMVARAVAQDTPLVLLDEPTAFLDPENRELIIRLLCDLARQMNKIVIFSTHEVELAQRYVHTVWRMDPLCITSVVV